MPHAADGTGVTMREHPDRWSAAGVRSEGMNGADDAFNETLAGTMAEIERLGVWLRATPEHPNSPLATVRAIDATMPSTRGATEAPPGRPWTAAAAAELIAAPRATVRPRRESRRLASIYIRRDRRSKLAVASAALLGALVTATATAIVMRSVRGLPAANNAAHHITAAGLTGIRAVSANAVAGVLLVVRYHGAPQAPLSVRVTAQTTAAATTVLSASYVLVDRGESLIALQPPSGQFAAGRYTVQANLRGSPTARTSFSVP